MQKRVEQELKNHPKADRIVIAYDNHDLPLQIKDSNTTCLISDQYYISERTDHFFVTTRESLFNLLLLHSIMRTKKALLWKRTAVDILLRWRFGKNIVSKRFCAARERIEYPEVCRPFI